MNVRRVLNAPVSKLKSVRVTFGGEPGQVEVETEKRRRTEINMVDSEKLPYKMKLRLVKLVGEETAGEHSFKWKEDSRTMGHWSNDKLDEQGIFE